MNSDKMKEKPANQVGIVNRSCLALKALARYDKGNYSRKELINSTALFQPEGFKLQHT